jgi:hypothetical protein
MEPSSIELHRARRHLRDFCEQRNRMFTAGPEWAVRQGNSQFEVCVREEPVLRLQYVQGVWHLSVPRAAGEWVDYPPRPRLSNIDAVIEELEQAPLHVHW